MRKLILIATLLLGPFALAQPADGGRSPAQPASPNSLEQLLAAQVGQIRSARLKAAPCPCEASEAYFTTIGETFAEPVASNVAQQERGEDFYGQVMVALLDQYHGIWATIASPNDPELPVANFSRSQPASMDSNLEEPGTNQDSYNQTIASQSHRNQLVEAVHRL